MSTLAVNTITNAAGGNTAQINGMTPTADSLQGFRNRLINSDMRIDQRNAGASVAFAADSTPAYVLDRWLIDNTNDGALTVQQSSTAPAGFTNSCLITVTSADASLAATQRCRIRQPIEGFNIADLGWGTASAQAVTLSFWVRSSLTGTFGGALNNGSVDRSYPFTYTISAANTWEKKTVTVAGDTSGTWLTTNGTGLLVQFGLGIGSTFSGTAGAWAGSQIMSPTGATSVVGTNGATFYITGVQLEAGSVATPFERRPYGTELQLCQRYFETTLTVAPADNMAIVNTGALAGSDAGSGATFQYMVRKRATPTAVIYAPLTTSPSGKVRNGNTGAITSIGSSLITASAMVFGTGTTANNYVQFGYAISAEL